MRERVSLDQRTGELSDRLADIILEFCKTIKGVPPTPVLESELVTFLSEARNEAWAMEASGAPPMKFPKRMDLRQRFRRTQPRFEPDTLCIAHLAEWLAVVLRAEEPERTIWERAIEKARKRSGELQVRLTLQQHFQVRRQKELEILNGPPPRRQYANEAWRLGKQGSQSEPGAGNQPSDRRVR